MSDEERKIFVDEDWKVKVQREQEEAKAAAKNKPAEEPGENAAGEAPSEEASFEALVSGLTMQAMVALGAMAPKDTKEIVVDLHEAKYLIDMLMMLREKTRGNLAPREQGLMTETLAELQQAFVIRSQQLQEAALRKSGLVKPDLG